MKCILIISITFFAILPIFGQEKEATVEAEIDTIFNYQFKSLIDTHHKKILIDKAHNTIYSKSYGKDSAREMLRIMNADGFDVQFTDKDLDSINLNNSKPDMLILHGMPNDKIVLNNNGKKEILYTSPLANNEVIDIGKYVYNGGSLFLFLSHFPNGSGALPLLEAFNVKFRDGAAGHQSSPGYNCGVCSQFVMTKENGMINTEHPVLKNRLLDTLLPKTVKFLCGAAIFRNEEDSLLPFPNNTTNYTSQSKGMDIEESSDSYSGMIGFDYGNGRVIVATDQGMFRSLDLLLDGGKIPVTIHDPECDNAALLLNSIRWLTKLQ